MDIRCPHFELCSGCQINTQVDHLELFVQAKSFLAKHGFSNLQLRTGSPTGWRCRAKLAVRGTASHPLIGLYEKGTHKVVDIPLCRVHHPAINQAADILRGWIRHHNITPYNEDTKIGLLRYVQMTVEIDSAKVQLVLVLNQSPKAMLDENMQFALKHLWESHPDLWHSLWINFNTRRDNVIIGDEWKRIYGKEWLWERYCGRQVYYHPASFFQANPEMFERLLEKVQQVVPQGAVVAEFYAGVGAIGLTLGERCQSITCTEVVSLAEECFKESLRCLPLEQQQKYTYKVCEAKAALEFLKPPVDTVIVDPPRKGLDKTFLQALNGTSTLQTLIYISCGWESFMRDCEMLVGGGWSLREAEAFLFFPGSDHLETLAVFVKGAGT